MSPSCMSLAGLLLAPLPALVTGLIVMSRAGVPAGIRFLNVAAALVGVVLVVATSMRPSPSPSSVALPRWPFVSGLALLAATLVAPGVAGVHRWVGSGPLEVHVGAVLLPSLLVFLTDLDRVPTFVVAFPTLAVLLLQPDAAQAASFAAGWGVWVSAKRGRAAAGPVAVAVALAGATWLRRDPLEPVAYVEGIVGVAAGQGAVLGAISLLALTLLPVPFLLGPRREAGTALAVYMAGTLVAAWLGDYPVPVLGYGVSPILGYYLAVAALEAQRRRRRSTARLAPDGWRTAL